MFRPDSGDPVDILCGTGADDDTRPERSPEEKGSVEVLWDIFGGTINDKGYKVLDPHVGLIYGDSITWRAPMRSCVVWRLKGLPVRMWCSA